MNKTACILVSNLFRATMLCSLLMIAGCGGCTKDGAEKTAEEKKEEDEKKEKEQEKEEKKPDFELSELIVKPNDPGIDDDEKDQEAKKAGLTQVRIGYVKPGHWTTGSLPAIANNFDFQGNLVARCKDSTGKQIPTEKTNYLLALSRPVSLPKGQKKQIEATWYVPRRDGRSTGTVQLEHELQTRSGKLVEARAQGGILMPDYQYYMVVLSTAPSAYKYLELLDSVKSESDFNDDRTVMFYRVTLPTIRQHVPLPDHSLNWTSIAYLIWDDLDPGLLTPDQQQAMLDWLHFGGQLIVNGPEGFAKLKNSFLDEYLPVVAGETVNLTADDLAELNDFWSIPVQPRQRRRSSSDPDPKKDESIGKRELKVTDETSPLGLRMQLSERGRFMTNTSELVAESRIGRGRIVFAGFSLESRQIINWQSWDGFFNSCLLRRPAKFFVQTDYEETLIRWQDKYGSIRDPLHSTTLRYISRDLGARGTPNELVPLDTPIEELTFDEVSEVEEAEINEGNSGMTFLPTQTTVPPTPVDRGSRTLAEDDWHYGGFRNSSQSGAAGWNDFSGVSNAARSALKESSGIIPPSSGFVLRVLGGYLLVLVPLNWLVFRLMGRLEWAWIAAPLIAIGGAILVVKLASLDIGFASSRTEVAVYEMYAGHSRGHLTRYTALYTSLSSNYEMFFEEGTTQAQPFAIDPYGDSLTNERPDEVEFRRENNWILKSFRVQSNSTAFLHSEQMHDVGGSFTLESEDQQNFRLLNSTGLDLHDVGVLRRDENGRLWKCWLGDLPAHARETIVDFEADVNNTAKFEQWRDSATAESFASISERMFNEHDADGNNSLSRDEVRDLPNVVRVFDLVDSDGGSSGTANGKLEREEFDKCLRVYGASDEVSLGSVFDMVSKHLKLAKGEARLVGWTSSPLSGMKIKPEAAQSTNKTFVLVHLSPGELTEPERDLNTKFDFARNAEVREEF